MVEAVAVSAPEAAGPHLQGGRAQAFVSRGEILCCQPSWVGGVLEQSRFSAPLGKDGMAKGLTSPAGFDRQINHPTPSGWFSLCRTRCGP